MYLDPKIIDFFDRQVFNICQEQISAGKKLAIALSGGADSVFVLLAFVDIFKAENLQVLHFNHKLRANADKEEVFVRNLCENLKVACKVGMPKVKIQKHSEEAFREARMAFFKDSASSLGIEIIAQGHHIGDVSESIIMRLMRGASLEGLVAPRHISNIFGISFVRPFLSIKKSQIMEFLESANQGWCEDESNATIDYLRNKVRHKVLPLLREICDRDFDEMALLSKTLLLEQQEFFEDICLEAYTKARLCENSIFLNNKHRVLLRGLITKFLYEKDIKLSLRAINDLLDKVEANASIKLSTKNGFLEFKDKVLSYGEKEENFGDFSVELNMGENILPNNEILKLEKISLGEDAIDYVIKNSNDSTCVYMDFQSLKFPLHARNRQEGDSIEYLGLSKPKKVQDIFVDKKVPRQMRDRIAIIIDALGDLLWVPSSPPSKKVLVRKKTDVIRLTLVTK